MLRVRWRWQTRSIGYRHDRRVVRDETFSPIGSLWIQRKTFASVSPDEVVENLDVKCGSSGSVTVDLYNSKALSTPTNPLIIYLPPAGIHLKPQHPSIPPFLFSFSSALASINYRWNIPTTHYHLSPFSPRPLSSQPSFTTHAFPTPLHDTLHSYSHLVALLQTRFSSYLIPETPLNDYWSDQTKNQRHKQIPRPILIYGSYLGGTLATSLALTESFSPKLNSTYITGLIAKNAILDWTSIATTAPPPPEDEEQDFSSLIRNNKPWTPHTLHSLKRNLFTNPASCFDNFVSPTSFFYSAGAIPPVAWISEDGDTTTISDELYVDVSIPPFLNRNSSISPSPLLNSNGTVKTVTTLDTQTTRPAHLKFPPRDSKLRIPRSLFLASPSSLSSSPSSATEPRSSASKMAQRLASKSKTTKVRAPDGAAEVLTQATELARLMRRSVVLHEYKDRAMYDSDVDAHAVSEERVRVGEVGGIGKVGKEEVVVKEWIEDTLES